MNSITKWRKEIEWERFKRFLDGFDPKYHKKIIQYHQLTCGDLRQKRSLYKSIREAKLNYQQVWEAIIND